MSAKCPAFCSGFCVFRKDSHWPDCSDCVCAGPLATISRRSTTSTSCTMTSRLTTSWSRRSETTFRPPLWTFVRPGSTRAASTTSARAGLVVISISHLKLSRKSYTHTKMTSLGLASSSVLSCSARACRMCCSAFPLTPGTFPWATTMPDLYAYSSVWHNLAWFTHDDQISLLKVYSMVYPWWSNIPAKSVYMEHGNNFQSYLWLPWSLIWWLLRCCLSREMEYSSRFNSTVPVIKDCSGRWHSRKSSSLGLSGWSLGYNPRPWESTWCGSSVFVYVYHFDTLPDRGADWIGLHLSNNDTCSSGHLGYLTQLGVSHSCL